MTEAGIRIVFVTHRYGEHRDQQVFGQDNGAGLLSRRAVG